MKRISIALFIMITCLGYAVSYRQAAQTPEAVVRFLQGVAPIKATSFYVKNMNLSFNKKFSASHDWFKHLSVDIENPSGKTVTYVDIAVTFIPPHDRVDLLPFRFSMTQGDKQKALRKRESGMHLKSSSDSNEKPRWNVGPGNSEKEYEWNRKSLTRLGYPLHIEEIHLQVQEVIFEDGTMWSVGHWYKSDPESPDKLIRISGKGSDEKVVAFFIGGYTLEDEETCQNPIYTNQTCSGSSCSARHVGLATSEPYFRITQGYERCYTRNAQGQPVDYCNQDSLVNLATVCPTPTPTPTPTPSCGPEDAGFCDFVWQSYCDCFANSNVGSTWNPSTCTCEEFTPIVIDTNGNGFSMTNAANGVDFDLSADGVPERLSWTSAGSDDAWLVLDRNGNNRIDDGTEMFGNYTPQPEPPAGEVRNGFLALAVFDAPANGGNGDGQIDRRDAVFNRLRLWRDSNHNGVSDANETRRLSVTPIRVLELDYRESRRVDQHGNAFRYRAIVRDEFGAQVGRWAWDVFLLRQDSNARLDTVLSGERLASNSDIFGMKPSSCRARV